MPPLNSNSGAQPPGSVAGGGGACGQPKPPTCYQKCLKEDKEKEKECNKLNREHEKKMKAAGCTGTTCKVGKIGGCPKPRKKCVKAKKAKPKKKPTNDALHQLLKVLLC